MSCTVCDSPRTVPAFEQGGFSLVRCCVCSHLWVDGASSADANYDGAYYAPDSQEAESHTGYDDYLRNLERRIGGFRGRLGQLETITGRRGRLLDFGCAVGACVKAAKDLGWDAIGCERSIWAAEYGRRTLGVDIVVGDIGDSTILEPGSFDVVTLWDVLEHLDRPREVIASVARLLRPGGFVALNTVNSSSIGARIAGRHWRHLAPPYHLQYFTSTSLQRLLADAGFEIVRREVKGVMFGSSREAKRLPQPLRIIEDAVTHWRTRRIATMLNLLDEIDITAVCRNDTSTRAIGK